MSTVQGIPNTVIKLVYPQIGVITGKLHLNWDVVRTSLRAEKIPKWFIDDATLFLYRLLLPVLLDIVIWEHGSAPAKSCIGSLLLRAPIRPYTADLFFSSYKKNFS